MTQLEDQRLTDAPMDERPDTVVEPHDDRPTMPTANQRVREAPRAAHDAAARHPTHRGLSRPAWHFLVDVLLFTAFVVVVCVSAILKITFPAPTAAAGWTLWSLSLDQWTDVQFASQCVFLLFVLIHLMLQWNWICNFVSSRLSGLTGKKIAPPKAVRTLYGVTLLITFLSVVAALLVAAELTIVPPPGP